jgi:transcriptional regulator with XRE-family HTH domain
LPSETEKQEETAFDMNEYNIGSQLRSLRKARNMTLQFVAGETGVSAPLLSQVENGNVTPSLKTLSKLATYFQIRMSQLLDCINKKPKYSIFRKIDSCNEERNDFMLIKRQSYCYSLMTSENNNKMRCSVIDLRSGITIPATSSIYGETFVYIIAGRVEISMNEETYSVEEGDSVYLDNSTKTGVKPLNCTRAKVMRVETA